MTEKADIKDLAIATWRLERWLDNLNSDRKMAAKSALRSIKRYVAAFGVEVVDPIGSKFDPGLAVEVVNNEADDLDESSLIIIETLAPYIYQNGELISHARVIIGTTIKEAKANNEILEVATVRDAPQAISEKAAVDEKMASDSNMDETDGKEDDPTIGAEEIERMMKYAKIL
jgi:hypothetical protein